MTQIAFSGVRVELGSTTILDDVTFTVARGERWGVVGRNGTGKTTLFRLITGELQPVRGQVSRASDLRLALVEQHREIAGVTTVWDAAAAPFAELAALEHSLAELAARLAEEGEGVDPRILARYDRELERFGREGGYTFESRVDAVLDGLGFDPAAARGRPLDGLSGGERGRLGLARQLAAPADVLLLDEPTNHLDLETTRWLEEYLVSLAATVLVVSHDRDFLERVADHVLHLEAVSATAYAGGYSAFVLQRAERRLTQTRAFDKQRRVVAAQEDYIRRNIAGQNSRQAKGRRRRLDRLPRLGPPPGAEPVMSLRLESPERGGDQVLVARGLRVAAGERLLLDGFTARVARGDVVGLLGPNGAGKSTLLSVLLGERAPEAGVVRLGASIRAAWYRQDLAQVPLGATTLYDVIHDLRPAWGRGAVQSHLGRFGFSGEAVRRRTETLSGGERARLAFAMLALSDANLLVLDEPTNHLDVESIEAVEDALGEYGGTVILVSHDRALLRALVTRVWSLRDGRIVEFDGSFGEWEAAGSERALSSSVETAVVARADDGPFGASARGTGGSGRARAAGSASALADAEARHARVSVRRPNVRAVRRRLADAEAEVQRLEAGVAELHARLEDPALYGGAEGARRALELGGDLESARAALERALALWERAAEAAEAVEAAGFPRVHPARLPR